MNKHSPAIPRVFLKTEWGLMQKPISLFHPDPEDFDGFKHYVDARDPKE